MVLSSFSLRPFSAVPRRQIVGHCQTSIKICLFTHFVWYSDTKILCNRCIVWSRVCHRSEHKTKANIISNCTHNRYGWRDVWLIKIFPNICLEIYHKFSELSKYNESRFWYIFFLEFYNYISFRNTQQKLAPEPLSIYGSSGYTFGEILLKSLKKSSWLNGIFYEKLCATFLWWHYGQMILTVQYNLHWSLNS